MPNPDVARTNDSCTMSKAGLTAIGYCRDRAVHHFVPRRAIRRSPLINRHEFYLSSPFSGYFTRVFAIRDCIQRFVKAQGDRKFQIVNLGAGFDSSYFELKLSSQCRYVEIDFENVMEKKALLIEENLHELLFDSTLDDKSIQRTSYGAKFGNNFVIVGCDLTDISRLDSILRLIVDFEYPTLIVAECSLTYLNDAQSDLVLAYFADNFPNCDAIIYEQITPDDAFGNFMLQHFRSINSPLQSIHRYPTLETVRERLKRLFSPQSNVRVCDLNHVYMNRLSIVERGRLEMLEPFDEFEMFHLTNAHYSLATVSSQSNQSDLFHDLEMPLHPRNPTLTEMPEKRTVQTDLRRFHHAAALQSISPVDFVQSKILVFENSLTYDRDSNFHVLEDSNQVFICGGIGVSNDGRHSRISTMDVLNVDNSEKHSQLISTNCLLDRSHHCLFAFSDKKMLIFGGRKSPVKIPPVLVSVDFVDQSWIAREINCDISGRWRTAAAVIDSNMLFYCGGRNGDKVFSDVGTINCDDFITAKYPPMPVALHSHSVAWDSRLQRILVSGGLDEANHPNSHLFAFCVTSKQWTILDTQDKFSRFGHSSHIIGCNLVLVGGVDLMANNSTGSILVINLENQSLNQLNLADNLMLVGHASIVTENGLMTIIGGGGNCFSFGTFFNKEITSIEISEKLPFAQK